MKTELTYDNYLAVPKNKVFQERQKTFRKIESNVIIQPYLSKIDSKWFWRKAWTKLKSSMETITSTNSQFSFFGHLGPFNTAVMIWLKLLSSQLHFRDNVTCHSISCITCRCVYERIMVAVKLVPSKKFWILKKSQSDVVFNKSKWKYHAWK